MMAVAEQYQIIEPSFTAFGPMHHMVAFDVAILRTARKLAVAVSAKQSASCGGRYRPGFATHIQGTALGVFNDLHQSAIAG